eukprot:10703026-Ditylum_brightwellii.AAC.1
MQHPTRHESESGSRLCSVSEKPEWRRQPTSSPTSSRRTTAATSTAPTTAPSTGNSTSTTTGK